ncbi:non-ribosomal peptide synthetase [Kitasatospora sp. NRRL B-11411]|uniref:non-ribosomal peptide synthetase n=1 Tax=Kitasatospora sp. NRRL B-11411 TaxID=1463822 RepID=UPI00068EFA53|nr:non-ribosomal peptide synthetase [Kitasatospora sp. NRRL B-11411]
MASVAVYLHRCAGLGEVTLGSGRSTIEPASGLSFREVVAQLGDGQLRYTFEELCQDLELAEGDGADVPERVARLERLLESLTAHPDTPVGRAEWLSPPELALLEEANATAHPVPATTLVDLVEAQVSRTPEAEAVRCAGQSLDFAGLDERANRIARLLAARGAGPGRAVAVALPRSTELVVALLGVLKSGAAYVPLDLDHPAGRLAAVLADTEPAAVLTDRAGAAALGTAGAGATLLRLDDAAVAAELAELPDTGPHGTGPRDAEPGAGVRPRPRPHDAAYVIHTSGTTGRPKGVVVSHAAICNRLLWMRHAYRIDGHDRILHKTPFGFDVSVWELFLPLISGATLVCAEPGGHQDPGYLAALIRRERITTAHFVPSMLQICVQDPEPWQGTGLRRIICSGEALPTALAARAAELTGARVHNLYGPTEAAVDVTAWAHSAADTTATVPIGHPVWNTRTHVLDAALRPVPPGATGELYVAGDQLADGYLGQPALTAQRFVADPYGPPGTLMYRTGDLVRRLPGGELEFIGRADQQIKLRGIRIEPAGIEAALLAHPQVRAAAVLLREDRPGHPYLAAYVVPDPGAEPDPGLWRAHLAESLPAAMVPGAFVALDRLPTTVNGKLDRAALPAPAAPGTGRGTGRGAGHGEGQGEGQGQGEGPRTARQAVLCELFEQVLGIPGVGPQDSFLELGGHSLSAARLSTLVRAAVGVELSIRELYAHPTPAALAERLEHAPAARPPLLAGPRPAQVPLSAAQASLWFLDRLEGAAPTYNMPLVLRPRRPLDLAALRSALADLTDRHEPLRTRLTTVDGTPVQQIAAPGTVRPELRVVDCPAAEIETHLTAAAHHRFDLHDDTPLWAAVYGSAPGERAVVLVLHHVAGDGWSLRPLARDLSTAYAARLAGRAPAWQQPAVQYADYALWQRELLADRAPESLTSRQIAFWKQALAGLPERMALPFARPRNGAATAGRTGQVGQAGQSWQAGQGGNRTVRLDARLHGGLQRLADESGASLFMVLHAALAALLTRGGAGTDIPIGTPVAARSDTALDDLIGHFANTLVLRTDTSGDPEFRELLARVKAADLAAYDHQDLPFELLVAELNPNRDADRHPLFQVMLALQNNADAELCLDGEALRLELRHTATAKFDLLVNAVERHGADGRPAGIEVRVDHRTDLFDADSADRLVTAWQELLTTVAADPARRLGELPALPEPPAAQSEADAGTRWEHLVRAQDGIRDCVALPDPSTGGSTGGSAEPGVPVVLAVPDRDGAVRRAAEAVRPARVVAVSDLPRTPQGAVDLAALRELPLLDEQSADAWERELAALPGVLSATVALEPDRPQPGVLQLTTSAATADRAQPADRAQQPQPGAAAAGPASLSVGPPLPDPGVATLTEALLRATGAGPQAEVVHVREDGSQVRVGYAQMLAQATRVLGGLRGRGLRPGDAVILQCDDNEDFLAALWGCILGGFVTVPLTVPPSYATASAARAKLEGVHGMLGRPWVVTCARHEDALREVLSADGTGGAGGADEADGAGGAAAPRVASVAALRTAAADTDYHRAQPEDTVLMLLTSGSTGLPKAVRLSHRNVLTRSAATAAVNSLTSEDVSLNWIPLDHVTGVVMFHLRDVFLGCRQVHAPTAWVLADPLRWLDLADRHRATVSWAPNFAFGLVAEHAAAMADRDWDLSPLRLLTNAGEVVVAATARRFLKLLAPYGLPQSAMHPGWGMSETSSVVTDSELPAVPTGAEGAVVSCGLPYPGFAMRVVDEQDRVVPEGTAGRLQVRGTSITCGYHDNPEQNAEAFDAEGWFETGDLAYLLGGELFLTGRAKDVIIINGVNHYSHEIEAVAEELPYVERSFTAACAVRSDPAASTDALALFVHLAPGQDEATALRELRGKVTRETGVSPAYLLPVAADEIPKTEIGKIQRTLLRRRFEAGEFDGTINRVARLLGTADTVPDWFLRPVWQRTQAGPAEPRPLGSVLVVAGGADTGPARTLAAELAEQVRADGGLCTVVTWADGPVRRSAADYGLRPDATEDWNALLAQLAADGRAPEAVVHLGALDADREPADQAALHRAQRGGADSLLCLAKALAERVERGERGGPVTVQLVTAGGWAVREGEQPGFVHATAGGLLKSLTAELPWLTGSQVDLEAGNEAGSEADSTSARLLLAELRTAATGAGTDSEVAFRGGRRWVRRLAPVDGPLPPVPARLPGAPDGFQVISGGLGGLSGVIAEHLLAIPGARLLLLGRTVLPAEDEWDAQIAAGSELGRRLATYRRLRELGEVRYRATDVTDEAQVRSALARAAEDWGVPLASVLHLAGRFDQRPAVEYTVAEWRAALAAKVTGGWVLARVAAEQPGAAFVAFSSVNGFFGGAFSGAYSAANAFLDALAGHQRLAGRVDARSLAWSRWDELGMSRGTGLAALTEARGYRTVRPADGLRSLRAALVLDEPHLLIGADRGAPWVGSRVVAPARPLHRLAAEVALAGGTDLGALHAAAASAAERVGTGDRWVLRTAGTRPAQTPGDAGPARHDRDRDHDQGRDHDRDRQRALEQELAAIWGRVLGTDRVGVLDNFFDLGGSSLLLAKVQALVNARFGSELTVVDLFGHPTVRALAAHLAAVGRPTAESIQSPAAQPPATEPPTTPGRRARDRAARRAAGLTRRPLATEGNARV